MSRFLGVLAFVLAFLAPTNGQCVADSLRLAGNATSSNFVGGRLEICLSNSWRALRFEFLTLQTGHVACRQLFPGTVSHAASVISSQSSGVTISSFGFSCLGTETDISSCTPTSNSAFGDSAILTCKRGSASGDIRIVGSSSSSSGRLQYFDGEMWRNVYYQSPARWTSAESSVVCKLLGYTSGTATAVYNTSVDTGPSTLLTSLSCNNDTSVSLQDCAVEFLSGSSAGRAATLNCLVAGSSVADGTLRVLSTTGAVLENSRTGIVEMAYQGRWGPLCYSADFGGNEEEVICNNLGYAYGGTATNASLQLTSSRPFWLDALSCTGSETNPLRCSNVNVGLPQTGTCGPNYLLSVSCDQPTDTDSYTAAISPGGITAILVVGLLTFGFAFPFIATGFMYILEGDRICSCPSPRRSRRRYSFSHSSATRTTGLGPGIGNEPTGDDSSVHEENTFEENTHESVLTSDQPPLYKNADKFEKIDLNDDEKPPGYKDNDLPPYPVTGDSTLPPGELPYPTATNDDAAYPPSRSSAV